MDTPKAEIGTISHATMLSRDLIPAFTSELERLNGDAKLIEECNVWMRVSSDEHDIKGDDEYASQLVEALFDALDELAPPFCYFAAHPGDGSDYGFWPMDIDDIKDDDDVLVVSDTSEVPMTFTGYVLHVNDHGNVTLYSVETLFNRIMPQAHMREVWAIV